MYSLAGKWLLVDLASLDWFLLGGLGLILNIRLSKWGGETHLSSIALGTTRS
jgi:hypothetical protein